MTNLEKAGRLLKLLGWINLVIALGIVVVLAVPTLSSGESEELFILALLAILAAVIPLLYVSTGNAVKRGRKWGKVAGAVIAMISVLSFPLGTIFGALILFYLHKGWSENT